MTLLNKDYEKETLANSGSRTSNLGVSYSYSSVTAALGAL